MISNKIFVWCEQSQIMAFTTTILHPCLSFPSHQGKVSSCRFSFFVWLLSSWNKSEATVQLYIFICISTSYNNHFFNDSIKHFIVITRDDFLSQKFITNADNFASNTCVSCLVWCHQRFQAYRVCQRDIFWGVSNAFTVSLRVFDTPWYMSMFQQYLVCESARM